MKVRYVWEQLDIRLGRYIVRQSSPKGSENVSFMCSVMYKIGFLAAHRNNRCLISITDGMVLSHADAKSLADHLNRDVHGFRPTTQKEVVSAIKYLKEQNIGG